MIHPLNRLRTAFLDHLRSCRLAHSRRARRAMSLRLMVENLEGRVVPTTIAWDFVNHGSGGAWEDKANWTGGVVPTANDDAVIDKLAAKSSISFNQPSDAAKSIKSTGTTALQFNAAMFNLGNGASAISGPINVSSNAVVTVASTASLALSGSTLTIDGTVNFNQNDVITLKTVYGVGTGQIIVNGLMNSTGTKFLTDPNTYSNTYITVNSGGQIKGIGNTFAPTVMTFNNGSILNAHDLMGNNFANTILILPATYAPLIVNNENLQFGEVDLLGGTLGAGQSLNLGSLDSSPGLFYKFIGDYTVDTDATLTLYSNVKSTLNGITLTVNGTVNFNQNDVITLKTVYGVGTGQIIVNGLMQTMGTKFLTDPNTYSNTYITINSGGRITGTGNTFAPTVMTFNNGSILNDGDLMGNNFANTILILPATYAPLVVNGKNLQFGEVDLLGGTLGAGQTLKAHSTGSR